MGQINTCTTKAIIGMTLGKFLKSIATENKCCEVFESKEKYPVEAFLSSDLRSNKRSPLDVLEDYFKHKLECKQKYGQKPNCNKARLEYEFIRISNSLMSVDKLRKSKLDTWLLIDQCRKQLEKHIGPIDTFMVNLPSCIHLQELTLLDFRGKRMSLVGCINGEPSGEISNKPIIESPDIKMKISQLNFALEFISSNLREDELKLSKQAEKPDVNKGYLISEIERLAKAQQAFQQLENSNAESWFEMYMQMKKVEKEEGLQGTFILEIPLRNINCKVGLLDLTYGEAKVWQL